MNRLIRILLLVLLLPFAIKASGVIQIDGIYYNISYGYASVARSTNYSGDIIIPSAISYEGNTYIVQSIDESAFDCCSLLTSIEIPNTVKYIGKRAFCICTSLKGVKIPNSVISIGESAFIGLSNATSIEVESGNEFYDSRDNCNAIIETSTNTLIAGCQNTIIPSSVTSIGRSAFFRSNIYEIEIPNSVTIIGPSAFGYCGTLTRIVIPNSVITISGSAFQNCTCLKNIVIPESVVTIDGGAFYASGLENIDLGGSVKTIGSYAFQYTPLSHLFIPASVTSIGVGITASCQNLTTLEVDENNSIYDSRDNSNAIIETESNQLIAGTKSTVIPNSVTALSDYSFYGSPIQHICIPNSVTQIGDYAFSCCRSLLTIELPNSVTKIGSRAFEYCSELTNISLPNTISYIGESAFLECRKISTLLITGYGEWQGGNLSSISSIRNLVFDENITALRDLYAYHTDIYSYASVPPICNDHTFNNYNGTLHVPANSLAAYFTADYWNKFENIVGDAVVPEMINMNQNHAELEIGDEITLTATISPSNALPNRIVWISSDNQVATVQNGKVTAVNKGECDIIAQCLNKQAVCHIVVNDTTATITLDQSNANILPNHIITIVPTITPNIPLTLSVTSSEPTVAAARLVSGGVQVVGIKEGTTIITVSSTDGSATPATCEVTVYTEPGDINCDGYVNITDVTGIIDFLLSGNPEGIKIDNADTNRDGEVNITDVTTLIDYLLSGNWNY